MVPHVLLTEPEVEFFIMSCMERKKQNGASVQAFYSNARTASTERSEEDVLQTLHTVLQDVFVILTMDNYPNSFVSP